MSLVPKMTSYHNKEPISCQKRLDVLAGRRLKKRSLLEVNEHFSDKPPNLQGCTTNFLSEEVRFGAKSKLTRMGVYSAYIPIRGNEFGAEDDLLSQ